MLVDLYWIDDERTRPALLAFLRRTPLVPNLVRIVRYLFKAAELRDDAELLGLLTHRFETTRRHAGRDTRSSRMAMGGRNSKFPVVTSAYTGATRNYFRRRAWRILYDRGRLGGPEYVRMAEQVLRYFSDGDAVPVFPGQQRKHAWGKTGDKTIDRFGTFYVFNRILYRNSPRYAPARGGFFVCKGRDAPGGPALPLREEAFPELWDRAPMHSCGWRWNRAAPRSTNSPRGPCVPTPSSAGGWTSPR